MIGGRHAKRVVILDDQRMFAESMQVALMDAGYDARLGVSQGRNRARSNQAVLNSVLRMEPSIALLDLETGPERSGMHLVRPLAEVGISVVAITASHNPPLWGEALWSGARKTLSKSAPLEEVLATVRKIRDGRPVMSREERAGLLQDWHQHREQFNATRHRLGRLTHREGQVLSMLMEGVQVGDIAERSVVSVATVRTQVKSILAKLEVSSQLAAAGMAHATGWIPPQVSVVPAQRTATDERRTAPAAVIVPAQRTAATPIRRVDTCPNCGMRHRPPVCRLTEPA